jgi:hypothetical protein
MLNVRLNSAEGFNFPTTAVIVAVFHSSEQRMSTKQSGPVARWNGESLTIQIIDDRSPINIMLKDASNNRDLMSVAYTLQQLRSSVSMVDMRIS